MEIIGHGFDQFTPAFATLCSSFSSLWSCPHQIEHVEAAWERIDRTNSSESR
jgi:hypothetical protein